MEDRLKCSDLVEGKFKDREKELQDAKNGVCLDDNGVCIDFYEWLSEFGLGFYYVEPHTYEDQKDAYYKWQLSWGGPGDEIRIYNKDRIEYWYLDWFDGAFIEVPKNSLMYELSVEALVNFADIKC